MQLLVCLLQYKYCVLLHMFEWHLHNSVRQNKATSNQPITQPLKYCFYFSLIVFCSCVPSPVEGAAVSSASVHPARLVQKDELGLNPPPSPRPPRARRRQNKMSCLLNGSEEARRKLASDPLNKAHEDPRGSRLMLLACPIIGWCHAAEQRRWVGIERAGGQRCKQKGNKQN